MRDQLLTLKDGRQLAITVSGPESGVPLIYHHGTPGCRLQSRALQAMTAQHGLRLVTYDRAGAGQSSRNPGRTVADVASDMAGVLDALDAPRCVVAGKSGGGPHALATAAGLPDRVAAVASLAGVAPYGEGFLDGMGQDNHDEFGLALEGEAALRPYLEHHREVLLTADAAGMVEQLASLLPDVDRQLLTDEAGADLVNNMRGGVQSVDGWLDDDLAFTRDWGFELSGITVPTYVWQGSADLMVPFHHGELLAASIPGATAHLIDGEGHFSVVLGRLDQIVGELASHL